MDLLPTATSTDEQRRGARVAVLPIGSFEQHGSFLPLTTDTIVACAIADAVVERYDVLRLPPVTISCSHEHSGFAGTVSIGARTLHSIVLDVAASLEAAGVRRLVLINGHGGNYTLGNVVQEANVGERRMSLFPARADWDRARAEAGMETSGHDDMHAGSSKCLSCSPSRRNWWGRSTATVTTTPRTDRTYWSSAWTATPRAASSVDRLWD